MRRRWRDNPAKLKAQTPAMPGPDMLGVVLKEPIGVELVNTPWNFRFWTMRQKLPFALAAGWTCVVKPSEMTPSTTVRPCDLLAQAGVPTGVANLDLGYGQPVGALTTSHSQVDMVTFSGSTAVAKSIMAAASGTLKKVAQELAGKNPQVIFPAADLQSAADAVTFGVMPKMKIAREAVFVPVLSVLTFRTLVKAIALANDAGYRLSAGVPRSELWRCAWVGPAPIGCGRAASGWVSGGFTPKRRFDTDRFSPWDN